MKLFSLVVCAAVCLVHGSSLAQSNLLFRPNPAARGAAAAASRLAVQATFSNTLQTMSLERPVALGRSAQKSRQVTTGKQPSVAKSLGCAAPSTALVGWWRAENNALDCVGGNHGTLVNGTGFSTGMVGDAFCLDGVDDAMLVPDAAALNFGEGQDFTIEAWIQPLSSETYYGVMDIVDKRYSTSWTSDVGYELCLVEGQLTFRMSDSLENSSSSYGPAGQDLRDENFHHVAVTVTRNSTTGGTYYVDGDPVYVFDPTGEPGDLSSTAPLRIGLNAAEDFYGNFNGLIDEVGLYNAALSASEIQAIFNAGPAGKCPVGPPLIVKQPKTQRAPVGTGVCLTVEADGSSPFTFQWRFNGTDMPGATDSALALNALELSNSGSYSVVVANSYGSTPSDDAIVTVYVPTCVAPPTGLVGWWAGEGNAYDSAGANAGQMVNGAGFGTGMVGSAFALDGIDDAMLVPDASALNFGPGQNFTIEAWIQPLPSETYYGVMDIVDKRYSASWSSDVGYELCVVEGRLAFRMSDSLQNASSGYGSAGPDLRDGTFHHVAVTVTRNSTTGGTYYVDGQPVFVFDPTGEPGDLSSTAPLRVGVGAANNFYANFNGLIDEVSVYRSALSAEQILDSHNAGVAGKCQRDPNILLQPASQTVAPGATATFAVVASGTAPLNYQWYRNGAMLPGATSGTLALNNVTALDAGSYRAAVSSFGGSASSAAATLTVSQLAAPAFSPIGRSYSSPQNVVVTCSTPDALIHYTTSGQEPLQTDPTVASGSSVLVDHNLTLKAKAWKAGWTASATESQGYRIEATPSDEPPTVTISPPTGITLLASDDLPILVEGADTDGSIVRVQLFRDGLAVAETTQSPLQFTMRQAFAGTYTFVAKAIDDAGFVTISPPTVVTVNASGPAVSLVGQQPFFTSSPGTLVASVLGVDPGGLAHLALNGEPQTAKTGTFTLTPALTEGANTFTLFATDTQNRSAQASATVYLDSVAPTIAITAPANNSTFNTTRITVNGTFTEGSLKRITVNGVPAFISGSSWKALNVPLAEGASTITAIAEDLAGNSAQASITVIGGANQVDPVQLTAGPVGGFAPLQVTFAVQAAVPGTLQEVRYDFTGDDTAFQTATDLQPITHTYSSAGQYFPVVTLITSAGRFCSAGGWNGGTERLRINVQAPPVVLATIPVTDPVDLKWMPGNYLYVLSRSSATLTEFDSSGTAIRTLSGIGTTPNGLDVDGSGRVYVAVTGDNQVRRFQPTANSFQLDTSFGNMGFIGKGDRSPGSGPGEFNALFDVTVAPDDGEIAVSDSSNCRIQRFTETGIFISAFGEQGTRIGLFSAPKGLAYDPIGTLFVVDSGNNRIELASPPLVFGTSGGPGGALGQFQGAINLSVGTRGVYVADTGNNRIQVFSAVAGDPTPLDPRLALSAEIGLNHPSSVAAVANLLEEKVYIADTGNSRVILLRLPDDNPEAVWNAMKQRLVAGDISGAMPYFSAASAEDYEEGFLTIGATDIASHTAQIPAISPVFVENDEAQYRFDQAVDGVTVTFLINFVKENGVWKIMDY